MNEDKASLNILLSNKLAFPPAWTSEPNAIVSSVRTHLKIQAMHLTIFYLNDRFPIESFKTTVFNHRNSFYILISFNYLETPYSAAQMAMASRMN